jgi:hypothetical protein
MPPTPEGEKGRYKLVWAYIQVVRKYLMSYIEEDGEKVRYKFSICSV